MRHNENATPMVTDWLTRREEFDFLAQKGRNLIEDRVEAIEDLIEAVAGGDRAAFARLFAAVAPRIKGYLMSLGARPGQAEELVQEVMFTVWQRAGDFDRKRAAGTTWIYAMARNRRIDLWRKEQRARIDPEEPLLRGPRPPEPHEELDASQQAQRVRKTVENLPPQLYALIRLAYFEGLTHVQIAHKTGLPLGTVKTRIRKATKIIGQSLDHDDG